jgi:uncharacterized protein (DUF433 family)
MTRTFEGFPRITINPEVMAGKPCIRNMRVTVGMILGEMGAGTTIDELLAGYAYLQREDVFEALRYAAWLAQGREVDLTPAQ